MKPERRSCKIDPGHSNRAAAKRYVRHFLADFAALEREYPDDYPKMIVSRRRRLRLRRGRQPPARCRQPSRRLPDRPRPRRKWPSGSPTRSGSWSSSRSMPAFRTSTSPSSPSGWRRWSLCDEPMFSFTNSGSKSNELAFKIARTYPRPPRRAGAHQDHLAHRLLSRLDHRHRGRGDRRRGVQGRLRAACARLPPGACTAHRRRRVRASRPSTTAGDVAPATLEALDRAGRAGDDRRDHRRSR